MRRNRKRGKGRLGDVPTLTDALETSIAPTVLLPAAEGAADPIVLESETDAVKAAADADPMSLDTLGDLPVLTDAVLDWPADDDGSPEPSAVPTLREPLQRKSRPQRKPLSAQRATPFRHRPPKPRRRPPSCLRRPCSSARPRPRPNRRSHRPKPAPCSRCPRRRVPASRFSTTTSSSRFRRPTRRHRRLQRLHQGR